MEIIQKFHEARFIHADLKPDNVLLHLKYQGGETPDIGVTLIDFGRTIDCSLYASEMQFAG